MEDIERHISELLFEHDCVIVPSLGGFLASNRPAQILASKNIIYPPFRHVAFNVFLKQNDGLLANRLAEVKNINYAEALQLIDTYTTFCFDTLEKGKKFILTEIGTLYYDKERNLQFEPFRNVNYLKDSFGMESVTFIPVQRGEHESDRVPTAEKYQRPSIPPDRNKVKQVILLKKTYIGALLVGAVLCWFAINLYLAGPKNYESTSLNPFDSQETNVTKNDSLALNAPLSANENNNTLDSIKPLTNTEQPVADSKEKTEVTNTSYQKESNKNIAGTENTEKVAPGPDAVSSTRKHYVIAGVFKIPENAEKLLQSLKQQGFLNARIIQSGSLNYVTFENATNKAGALAMIDSLQRKNLSSWIWMH